MTSLAITDNQTYWTNTQIGALKQLGLAQASAEDLAFFFHQAQRTGLDPFARQIYMINRGGKYGIQTSIDGFRIIAQRSGNYGGQTMVEWCGDDGVWKDVWLSKIPPSAARVGVYYKNSPHATYATAKWDSYAVLNNPIWKKMPDVMLAKCAESLALRKAFPNDMSGIYTDEEMAQAEVQVIEPKAKPKPVALQVVSEEPDTTDGIDWEGILSNVVSLTDKEQVKAVWAKQKAILDLTIPGTEATLRTLLINKVANLENQ